MNLIDLVRKEERVPQKKLLFMMGVAGLSNAAILAIIVTAAQAISSQESGFRMLVLFALTIVVFAISQRYVFKESLAIIEMIVEGIRNRVSDKIRRSEMITLERMGTSEIYSRLTTNTSTISQLSSVVVAGFQCVMVVVFAFLYIATLSIPALILCVLLIIVGVGLYLKKQEQVVPYIKEATRKEVGFFSMITHLLDGFVEHKVNRRRSDALMQETRTVAAGLKRLKLTFMDLFIANQIFSQVFMYLIMAVIVFILPRLVPTYHQAINQIAATLLFIIGPLGAVVNAIPAYTNANLAASDVIELEHELDSHLKDWREQGVQDEPRFHPFGELVLEDLEFSYLDKEGRPLFSVGPVHFRIRSGETVFVTGGNGSGKSTLFKLLIGLYTPNAGRIKVNSVLVDDERSQAYRELFSIVFSDFHLFDRLYGFNGIEDSRVNALLCQMKLDQKTCFENGRFTNLDLSSGQRKRLALIVALLEDRPIFVLDEWAAEQDPSFRRYFYEEILADLKRRGKAVVAITHDERYLHVADRVLKMDFGKFL